MIQKLPFTGVRAVRDQIALGKKILFGFSIFLIDNYLFTCDKNANFEAHDLKMF